MAAARGELLQCKETAWDKTTERPELPKRLSHGGRGEELLAAGPQGDLNLSWVETKLEE